MEGLKAEMQRAIDAYSEDAISRYERSLMPMGQDKRIEARSKRQNLVASLARLDVDPTGASIERAGDELNYSRAITWAMQCMTAVSQHEEIKGASGSKFLEELRLEAARFDGLDVSQMSDAEISFLMAIATLVDVAAEVFEGQEYGSCLFSQSQRSKTIRMPLSVLQQAGCVYILTSGEAFIKRGGVYLEVENVRDWGDTKEIHLSGREFQSTERAEMEYEVELQEDAEYLVMGSMTPRKFMEHCNFRKNVDIATFEPFPLLDKKRIQKWIETEAGGLMVEATTLKYNLNRIYVNCTWLHMEDGKLVSKNYIAQLTRRIGVNVTKDPGIVLGASCTWTKGEEKERGIAYLIQCLRRGADLPGKEGHIAANAAAHALIMINNYSRAESGPVMNYRACLFFNVDQNGVKVRDPTWLSARLAGWEPVPGANAVLDPIREEFDVVKTKTTTGIAHANRTGYNRIECMDTLSNMTKVYGEPGEAPHCKENSS